MSPVEQKSFEGIKICAIPNEKRKMMILSQAFYAFLYLLNQPREFQQITHGVLFMIKDQTSYVPSLSNFKFLLTGKVHNVYRAAFFQGKKKKKKKERKEKHLFQTHSHLVSSVITCMNNRFSKLPSSL